MKESAVTPDNGIKGRLIQDSEESLAARRRAANPAEVIRGVLKPALFAALLFGTLGPLVAERATAQETTEQEKAEQEKTEQEEPAQEEPAQEEPAQEDAGAGASAAGQGPEVNATGADLTGRSDALAVGNRLFGAGELEAAVQAYKAGFRPEAPHPTLVYNLATTLHHLDRLPEAILWYRRGAAEDPWLQENLWLARRSLGSQRLNISGLPAFAAEHGGSLFGFAVVCAWLSLLAALWPPVPRRAWAGALALAILLWLSSVLLTRYGPREAVLLSDCSAESGELPAGTELWFWPAGGESLAVAGFAGTHCPHEVIGWIEPSPP